ncbi:MAG: outer membrane beta-barrel protein [Terriglobia bacterium]
MKLGKLMQGFAIVTALCASASVLRAQGVSVFAMGSVSSLFDKRDYGVNGSGFSSSYKTGGGVTLGAEFSMNRFVGVEASYSNLRNNLAITNTSTPAEFGYGVHDQRFSGDLLAHAPKAFVGLRPYLAFGGEYDHFSQPGSPSGIFDGFSDVTLGAANKVGVNYGGGVDMKLMPFISLRVDVRDHVMTSPTYGLPSKSSVGAFYPVGGIAHDLEYSAGIVVHLGK